MMLGDLISITAKFCCIDYSNKANKLSWKEETRICKISELTKYKILVNDTYTLATAIEPIPLTPEILEANGFKFVGEYEWSNEIHVSRYRYRDGNGDIKVELNYAPNYDGFTWKGIEINNVHKLQHALRLCGLTELADNFKV